MYHTNTTINTTMFQRINTNDKMIFSIDGNIGSGKSTFYNYIKEHFSRYYNKPDGKQVYFVEEPVKDWEDIKDADGNVIDTNVEESVKEDGQTWEKTATENVYQGIDQAKLVPLLTAALQEAITKIETLETKITALESK